MLHFEDATNSLELTEANVRVRTPFGTISIPEAVSSGEMAVVRSTLAELLREGTGFRAWESASQIVHLTVVVAKRGEIHLTVRLTFPADYRDTLQFLIVLPEAQLVRHLEQDTGEEKVCDINQYHADHDASRSS